MQLKPVLRYSFLAVLEAHVDYLTLRGGHGLGLGLGIVDHALFQELVILHDASVVS